MTEKNPTLANQLTDITDEDQYHENPERRRLYFLKSVQGKLTAIEPVCEDFRKLHDYTQKALSGGYGANEINVFFFNLEANMPPSFVENKKTLEALRQEILNIAYEKGFRDTSILTAREHKQISSTVGNKYQTRALDIPLGILAKQFQDEGKTDLEWNPLSIEETDRARRLKGKTRLNLETGEVTEEIDEEAKSDSYFFLSPERRAAIQIQETEILTTLQTIADSTIVEHQKSSSLLTDFEAYSEGKLSTAEILEKCRIVQERSANLNLNFFQEIVSLNQYRFEAGLMDNILTLQEIYLRTSSDMNDAYPADPYLPLGLEDGRLTLEEVKHRRAAEGWMVVTTTLLGYEYPFAFRLEELDEQGKTIKSPTFLDKGNPQNVLEDDPEFRKTFADRIKISFPFARDNEWFTSLGSLNQQ